MLCAVGVGGGWGVGWAVVNEVLITTMHVHWNPINPVTNGRQQSGRINSMAASKRVLK